MFKNKNKIVYDVEWSGEMGAGIRPGSEVITIEFANGPIDEEMINFFAGSISEYFENTDVTPRS